MANGGPATAQAGSSGPKPAPPPLQSESAQSKKDLSSWWKNFKRSDRKAQEPQQVTTYGIFGVPLQTSIRYANVAISLFNEEGQSYIYGYVPIVVAKCGVFLKEKATDVEGIFRLAGSEKRIKELKVAFDSPDRYGKGLDWTGYTVHDAANILRRYFNQLPEPIIPLEFYERFRDPLRNHQAQAVGAIEAQSPSVGDFHQDVAIRAYQALITELPPLNRQLLLYILDLLAVFASKSDLNKMTTPNLAAIFQPGLLSHPQHDMAPQEYRLSQDILIFLIENQDSFLIGMPGTEADKDTVKEVQSGVPSPDKTPSTPTTPIGRSKTIIGRNSSNSSTDADGKWSSLRRNVSVSSRHSKRSEAGPTPATPGVSSPTTTGASGVYRSNTAPSRRTGSAAQSPRFPREKISDPLTPSGIASNNATLDVQRHESLQSTPTATSTSPFPAGPEIISASSSEATTPLATIGSDTSSAINRDYQTPKKDTTPLLAPPGGSAERHGERSPSNTPSTSSARAFLDIFKQSPTSDSDGRKPNKLQKKRIPGSALSSAQSSAASLQHEITNEQLPKSPVAVGFPPGVATDAPKEAEHSAYATTHIIPVQGVQATPQRMPTEATLRPTVSPTHSIHSRASVTDQSDADMVGDDMPAQASDQPETDKKKRRWRFSRAQNKLDQPLASSNPLGTMSPGDHAMSRSTIGSGTGTSISQPRKSFSFQEPVPLAPVAADPAATSPVPPQQVQPTGTDPVFSDSEREKKGPMSWIRGKLQERKEKEAEKRAKTPEHDRSGENKQDLRAPREPLPVSGKSSELLRGDSGLVASSTTAAATEKTVEHPHPQAQGNGTAANGDMGHEGDGGGRVD